MVTKSRQLWSGWRGWSHQPAGYVSAPSDATRNGFKKCCTSTVWNKMSKVLMGASLHHWDTDMNYNLKLSAGEFFRTKVLKRENDLSPALSLSFFLLQSELITPQSRTEPAGLRAGQVMRLQNAIYKGLKLQQSFHTGTRSSATLHYVDLIWKQQEKFSPTLVIKVNWKFSKKKKKKNAFCCHLFFHAQLHRLFISLIKLSRNTNSDLDMWVCGYLRGDMHRSPTRLHGGHRSSSESKK